MPTRKESADAWRARREKLEKLRTELLDEMDRGA
jgi:hypothetical protein